MAAENSSLIRAVVLDDSQVARDTIATLLRNDGIFVTGVVSTLDELLRHLKRHHPDILVMDARMKGAGLDIARQIMRELPLPIIMLSTSSSPAELLAQSRDAGAVALVPRPEPGSEPQAAYLLQTVRTMAGVRVVHHWGRQKTSPLYLRHTGPLELRTEEIPALASRIKIIAIAASTGGPATVANIIGGLPAEFPWPVLLVQHTKMGFGPSMVEWLAMQTKLRVKQAEAGEIPQPATLYFAPDDYHLQINLKGAVELLKTPAYKTLRPSANPTFKSLAAVYGARAMGIILTGMGDDGADGLEALCKSGGYVIAQDEKSCVVYGMPRCAVEMGIVHQQLTPTAIIQLLIKMAEYCAPNSSKPQG